MTQPLADPCAAPDVPSAERALADIERELRNLQSLAAEKALVLRGTPDGRVRGIRREPSPIGCVVRGVPINGGDRPQ